MSISSLGSPFGWKQDGLIAKETVTLPSMVDVIISDARLYGDVWGYAFEEWMGYFLLRESMLDSLSPL